MYTRKDAYAYVVEAIENGPTVDAASEYDVEAIADGLYDESETWDMDLIDEDLFWWTVQRHSLDRDEREAAGDRPTTIGYKTDQIIDQIYMTREKIRAVRMDLDALESESSQLIVRAYRTGAFTQKRLAELAGISQQRVSQLLAR